MPFFESDLIPSPHSFFLRFRHVNDDFCCFVPTGSKNFFLFCLTHPRCGVKRYTWFSSIRFVLTLLSGKIFTRRMTPYHEVVVSKRLSIGCGSQVEWSTQSLFSKLMYFVSRIEFHIMPHSSTNLPWRSRVSTSCVLYDVHCRCPCFACELPSRNDHAYSCP